MKRIKHDLNILVEWRDKRVILKDKLKLRIKKWSSRPANIDSFRFSLIRMLHSLELINIWEEDTLFININEVLFSNKTKQEYSWVPKGKWGKIGNILFSGSKSLIVAITSNGDWFATYLLWNNNSDVFIEFMKKLILWIKLDLHYDLKKTIIILENLRVHKSKTTLKSLWKWEVSFSFIPAYTPEIAPIELVFNILKKRLIKQNSLNWLKLDKREAFREIREAFSSIDKKEIQMCFCHSFKVMSEYLKGAFSKMEEFEDDA